MSPLAPTASSSFAPAPQPDVAPGHERPPRRTHGREERRARGALTLAAAAALLLGGCTSLLGDDFMLSPTGTGAGGTGAASGGGAGANDSCGNGVKEGAEECDTKGASKTCDDDCTLPECGDGTLNPLAGEQCDDGNQVGGDACSKSCQITPFEIDDIDEGSQPDDDLMFGLSSAVAVTREGDEPRFAVVWTRLVAGDLNQATIVMRLYRPDGTPVSSDVTTLSTKAYLYGASIAANPLGRMVAVWVLRQDTDNARQLRYRVIEPGGKPAAGEDQWLADADVDGLPAVAATDSGEFCIGWPQTPLTPDPVGTQSVSCLDSSGKPTGGAIESLGKTSTGSEAEIWGAHSLWATKGGFVAAWYDTETALLRAQALTATGMELEKPFSLSSAGNAQMAGTGLGSTVDTRFIAGFSVEGPHGNTENRNRFVLRRFAAPNKPNGPDQLASDTHEDEYGGRLVGSADGRFLGVWSRGTEASVTIKARRFEPDATPLGPSFDLSEEKMALLSFFPRGAATEAGDVLVTWTDMDASKAPAYAFSIRAALLPRTLAQ